MIVYRSHSVEFQEQIENSDQFHHDHSRTWNQTDRGVKNTGRFFYYAYYKKDVIRHTMEGLNPVFEYELDPTNVLDIRTIEGRKQLPNLIDAFIEWDRMNQEDIKRIVPVQVLPDRIKRETTIQDILEDNPIFDKASYWGDMATDFMFGNITRTEIKGRYSGLLFNSEDRTYFAMLEPAEYLRRYWL